MSLSFTNMHVFVTDPELPISPSEQVKIYIRNLNCELKEWQIVAPTATIRELYFTVQSSEPNPKSVTGSKKALRDMALNEKKK